MFSSPPEELAVSWLIWFGFCSAHTFLHHCLQHNGVLEPWFMLWMYRIAFIVLWETPAANIMLTFDLPCRENCVTHPCHDRVAKQDLSSLLQSSGSCGTGTTKYTTNHVSLSHTHAHTHTLSLALSQQLSPSFTASLSHTLSELCYLFLTFFTHACTGHLPSPIHLKQSNLPLLQTLLAIRLLEGIRLTWWLSGGHCCRVTMSLVLLRLQEGTLELFKLVASAQRRNVLFDNLILQTLMNFHGCY